MNPTNPMTTHTEAALRGDLEKRHFRINSQLRILEPMMPSASEEAIKQEPMLFKCDRAHAQYWGGPLTRAFLSALPKEFHRNPIYVDSRTHMLMPGWYPCIPGWHHDDVPRDRCDGQPEYANPSYSTKHVLALWGDASLTEFAEGDASFPEIPIGSVVYKEWHPIVEQKIESGELSRFIVPELRMIGFNDRAWHRGVAAHKSGWRFFIRATVGSGERPRNERRTQVQVYLPALNDGW